MVPQLAGHWFRSASRYGPLFHASLRPAQENSGKLVTLVKQQARLLALDDGYDAVLVDGPPGIGCPVISAASGADLALIVAEPTAPASTTWPAQPRRLRTSAAALVHQQGRYHPEGTAQIEAAMSDEGIEVVGRIPFDTAVTDAMVLRAVTAFNRAARGSGPDCGLAAWQSG